MIKNWVLMLVLMYIAPVYAQMTVTDIAMLTGSPQALKGDFKQDKFIKAFEANIISTGHFEYQRNQFINWNTVSPVENQMVMTPKSITSKQSGNELVNLKSEQNPAVKMLSKIFFAVLTAEWQTLNAYFYQTISGDHANWSVALLPKDELLKQNITKVDLVGNDLLREVILHEKNGDTTHIYFSNIVK